jgi:RNA polymerase sigma-70 factor (ECF subfamily)
MKIRSVSDETLVTMAQGGSEAAFSELTERNYSSSLKLAVSILKDRHEAEDEVQNAYWKAYRHLSQFQQDSKFSTWMTRIVVNQCLMRLRQKKRVSFFYLDDAAAGDDRKSLELTDERQTPEQRFGMAELAQVLNREIHRIPPVLRNAFLLRDVQELPMPEVAKQLGISVVAAKSRLLRARAELRERLRKHAGRLGIATLTA